MDSKQSMSSADSEILARNGLFYKMPQSLSTSVDRTFKKEFAQKQSYTPNQTMVFDLNTGSDYIDPKSCMLSFNLAVVATTTPNAGDVYDFGFGSGTAVNLIREIRLISKNGTEVDRIQNANILAKILTDYTYSEEGQKTLQMAGYEPVGGTSFAATNADRRYVIPMSLISGFFRPTVKGMKIPSGLSSGMRIEITLEAAARALHFTTAGGTVVTYTVSDPVIYMMSHSLNDPTQAALMKNSAETGLEYTFPSYFNTPESVGASATVNIQVKKAVAQATSVFAGLYDNADAQDEAEDSFASIGGTALTNFQYRVGASYYPQQVVQDTTEAWYVSLSAFNKNRDIQTFPANVDQDMYEATGNGANGLGKFVLATALETDSLLNLSGVPLNNSNVLELRATTSFGSAHTYHLFLEYISVSRTFINKSSIKI
jgi:hypothetical protein